MGSFPEPNSCTPSCDQLPEAAHGRRQRQYMGTLYVDSMPAPPVLVNAATLRLPPPNATDFRVPPLRCSFPSLLHPQYELVKEQCDGWILDVGQPASASGHRLLLDCILPRLVCRNIPTASSLLRLIHVTKMISWLIISDDDHDLPEALGADDIATTQSAALVMAIFRSQEDAMSTPPAATISTAVHSFPHQLDVKSTTSAGEPIRPASARGESKARALEVVAELWGEMRTEMTPNLRERFIASMADYLEAVKVQAVYRRAQRLPDMEAYKEIRRQACFLLPAFTLVEYAVGIELGEDVYGEPELQEFRMAVVDYICLCNDLLSCRVEIGVGDYFNMPSIVYYDSTTREAGGGCALTFQEAIDHAARMTEELDARIVGMLASIHKSSKPSLLHPSVSTYVAALGSCMSGSLAWFLETARYRTST